jgi:hypothetical protein
MPAFPGITEVGLAGGRGLLIGVSVFYV